MIIRGRSPRAGVRAGIRIQASFSLAQHDIIPIVHPSHITPPSVVKFSMITTIQRGVPTLPLSQINSHLTQHAADEPEMR